MRGAEGAPWRGAGRVAQAADLSRTVAILRILRIFLLSLLVVQALPVTADGQTASTGATLHPGDVVRVSVWMKPELSGDFQVLADGSLADPFYQEVMVGGLPITTAVERIKSHIAIYEASPRVLVEPLFRVTVGGQVRSPNVYQLDPQTTIMQALMLAGGPTEQGRLEDVRLVRNGQELRIDLTASDGQWAMTPVTSGDQIFVSRGASSFLDIVGPAASVISVALGVVNLLLR